MKTLEEFLTESLVNEAFASSIMENITWKGVLRYGGANMPQWSKIKDSDLTEVTYDEAIKMYRKKYAPYIFWVSKNTWRIPQGKIALITWGTDVVWTGLLTRGDSTKALIDSISCEKAYVLTNPSDFVRWKIQRERRIAKEGAKALMSAEAVRKENLKRYKLILDERRTGTHEEVAKKMEEAMNIYSETVKNFIVKYSDMLAANSPSRMTIKKLYEKLTITINSMLDSAEFFEYWKNDKGMTDFISIRKEYYDDVIDCCNRIAELCTKLNEEQA